MPNDASMNTSRSSQARALIREPMIFAFTKYSKRSLGRSVTPHGTLGGEGSCSARNDVKQIETGDLFVVVFVTCERAPMTSPCVKP